MTFQVADGSVSCAVCLCGCLRVCVFACVPVCACVYACMVGQVLWLIVYLLVCLFVRCFCVCAVSVYVYVCARVRLRLLFCVAGLSQRCTPSGMRELSCVGACLIASCAIEGSRLQRLAAMGKKCIFTDGHLSACIVRVPLGIKVPGSVALDRRPRLL